ncbi:hypothetical protein NYO67_4607 [Aspergillus flavus]|nr:hypothetical protein NYO67_4607 [Aspergillus flavus]
MDTRVWDPIQVCGISDPSCTTTCYGQTLTKASCKNRISKESRKDAAHLIQLLAQRPADHNLLESLKKIARLLLCKRNHQHQEGEQVRPLATRWYESGRASGALQHMQNSRAESQQLDHPLYPEQHPLDRTSTLLTPMDVEPATAVPQSICMEQLRQRSIQFEVSPTSPARIAFGTPNADNALTPVILRTLGQEDGSSRRECLICHDDAPDDLVYLKCARCRRSVHLGCMGAWFERRWRGVHFNCPQCRRFSTFDAFYSTAEAGEAENRVEDSGDAPAPRGEITAEGGLVQGLRRSGRRTRRPDYYVP